MVTSETKNYYPIKSKIIVYKIVLYMSIIETLTL